MPFQRASSNDLKMCPECHGTGYVVRRMVTDISREVYGEARAVEYALPCPLCHGGHAQKVETMRTLAEIPRAFYDKKYDSFDWTLYRDAEGNPMDLSRQKRFVDSFISSFEMWDERGLGLYIWGHVKGCGKTFLASCICNELMGKYAMGTRFISTTNLLNIAQSADRSGRTEWERDPIGFLCSCKLLVLDDLGQKNTGAEWLTDILFRITDERMQKKLVTIITSNIRLSELSFDDRVVDRINKICQPIPLPDYCVRAREANDQKASFFRELGLI